MSNDKEKLPSEVITEFLNNITYWKDEYNEAYANMEKEGKRLQDLLHDLEFSKNTSEKNKAATKLRNSRRIRRQYKDKVQTLELIVEFFNDDQNVKVINRLTQLLGKQRKTESYIQSDRSYVYRVNDEEETVGNIVKNKKNK